MRTKWEIGRMNEHETVRVPLTSGLRTNGNRVFDLHRKITPQQLLPQIFQVDAKSQKVIFRIVVPKFCWYIKSNSKTRGCLLDSSGILSSKLTFKLRYENFSAFLFQDLAAPLGKKRISSKSFNHVHIVESVIDSGNVAGKIANLGKITAFYIKSSAQAALITVLQNWSPINVFVVKISFSAWNRADFSEIALISKASWEYLTGITYWESDEDTRSYH